MSFTRPRHRQDDRGRPSSEPSLPDAEALQRIVTSRREACLSRNRATLRITFGLSGAVERREACLSDSMPPDLVEALLLRKRRQRFGEPLAGVEGLEPPTPGFGDRCSGQLSYTPPADHKRRHGRHRASRRAPLTEDQSMTGATTPAPTVRPPSRMAKRSFSSMAIGTISVTSIAMLSPGITISVPSGSVTTPVTSVVRK